MSDVVVLRPIKSNVPIIVWRRSSWTSMPHVRENFQDQSTNAYLTYCGRNVLLGEGIVAITLTQITAEMYTVVGCGKCTQGLVAVMRAQLDGTKPDIRKAWNAKLKAMEWMRKSD